jgi:hypothetical protein
LKNIKVGLRPIVSGINLPTVIKSALLPGDSIERLFIATQVGQIMYSINGKLETFLDIQSRVIELGANGGYDERGLVGLAFHPDFYINGRFYLHYALAGSQGPGALAQSFKPNPCDENTLNLKWMDRETKFDHIDTVEEWIYSDNTLPQKRRTLLNLRRPFMNHNGIDSLNFSPETGRLVLTTGDGGSGFDPFNLAQDTMEIAGKIIEIDVDLQTSNNSPVVSRFDELPLEIQRSLTIIGKGGRNITGISYQEYFNQTIKYVGNVGQGLVESIYSFIDYNPIPVSRLVEAHENNFVVEEKGFINLGWRAWEGDLPTLTINPCLSNQDEKTIAYYNEAIHASVQRLQPLTTYYHQDPRPNKFSGSALTSVKPYMGNQIPDLNGAVIFTDWSRKSSEPTRGAIGYTFYNPEGLNDYGVIEIINPSTQPAFFVSLGTNLDKTRLFLGVYASTNVTNRNQGTVYEIIPL